MEYHRYGEATHAVAWLNLVKPGLTWLNLVKYWGNLVKYWGGQVLVGWLIVVCPHALVRPNVIGQTMAGVP